MNVMEFAEIIGRAVRKDACLDKEIKARVDEAGEILAVIIMEPFEDYDGLPRCQQLVDYVDAPGTVQCALIADHGGDCDTLPDIPDDPREARQ